MLDIKEQIISNLKRIVKELTAQDIIPKLEHPKDERHGDYSTNVAMIVFKVLKDTKVSPIRQVFDSEAQTRGAQGKKVSKGEPEWKTPLDLAREIASILNTSYLSTLSSRPKGLIHNTCSRVEAVAPGFINFWLSKEYLTTLMIRIIRVKDKYGRSKRLENKKIMVEYAHPNTHKEMHIGHMRTLITGEALSRILEEVGAKVFRANYQGDIGPHVAKAMYGIQKILEEIGLTIDTVEKRSNKEKAHFLGEAYVRGNQEYEAHKDQIDGINAILYSSSEGAPRSLATESRSSQLSLDVARDRSNSILDLYKKTRQWSLDYYDELYKRFYTKFDKLFFESEMVTRGKEIVEANLGTVFRRDQGAIVFKGEPYGLHTRVFITQAGYPTYEGKEMANAFEEYEAFAFDKKIHIVASEQKEYFQVVFKALELIDPEKFKDRQYHIPMGMVHLVGRKMSSRTGDVLTVDSLIDRVKEKVSGLVEAGKIKKTGGEDVAEEVAIGAIKYFSLKVDTKQDVAFDIEKSVSLDGNSGPYLQYTYARTQSVLAKVKSQSFDKLRTKVKSKSEEVRLPDLVKSTIQNSKLKFSFARPRLEKLLEKLETEEMSLLRTLQRFPEIVEEAAESFAPNLLCNYLFDLAQKFNLFYQRLPIINPGVNDKHPRGVIETSRFRLSLTAAVGQIIKNGLYLLGIEAPTKM